MLPRTSLHSTEIVAQIAFKETNPENKEQICTFRRRKDHFHSKVFSEWLQLTNIPEMFFCLLEFVVVDEHQSQVFLRIFSCWIVCTVHFLQNQANFINNTPRFCVRAENQKETIRTRRSETNEETQAFVLFLQETINSSAFKALLCHDSQYQVTNINVAPDK